MQGQKDNDIWGIRERTTGEKTEQKQTLLQVTPSKKSPWTIFCPRSFLSHSVQKRLIYLFNKIIMQVKALCFLKGLYKRSLFSS